MITMRCADEKGWPERAFHETGEGANDYSCDHCGWCQTSFEAGCRELVLSATWHSGELLASYITEARRGGPLAGTVTLDIEQAGF